MKVIGKYMFVLLLLVGIVLQSSSKLIILINFQINKEYISKNLCVQKNIKGNCCKGSCHLKKELKEDDKKQENPTSSLKDKNETQLFYQTINAFKIYSSNFELTGLTPYIDKYSSITIDIIAPPPKA